MASSSCVASRLLQGAPVRDFDSVEAMRAHAKAVKARLMGPVPAARPPAGPRVLVPRSDDPRIWHIVDKDEVEPMPAPVVEPAPAPADRPDLDAMTPRYTQIIRIVARHHDVSVAEIKGPRRDTAIVRARHLTMVALFIECPLMSLPQIGRRLGGKDHTTVLHAARKFGVAKSRRWPADLFWLRDLMPTAEPAGSWSGEGCA